MAKLFIFSLCLCLASVHSKGWIGGDPATDGFKPPNFAPSKDGQWVDVHEDSKEEPAGAELDAAIAAEEDAAADKYFNLDPVDEPEDSDVEDEVPVISKAEEDADASQAGISDEEGGYTPDDNPIEDLDVEESGDNGPTTDELDDAPNAEEEVKVDTPGENPMGEFYEDAGKTDGIPVEDTSGPVDTSVWDLPEDAESDSQTAEVKSVDIPEGDGTNEEEVDIPGESPMGDFYDKEAGDEEPAQPDDILDAETVESEIDSLIDDVEEDGGPEDQDVQPEIPEESPKNLENEEEPIDPFEELEEDEMGAEPDLTKKSEVEDDGVEDGDETETDQADDDDVITEVDSEDILKEMDLKEKSDDSQDEASLSQDGVDSQEHQDDADDGEQGKAFGGDDHDYQDHGSDTDTVLGGDDVDKEEHGADVLGGDDHDYKEHGAYSDTDIDQIYAESQDNDEDSSGPNGDVKEQNVDIEDAGHNRDGDDDNDDKHDDDDDDNDDDDDDKHDDKHDDDDDDKHEISAANYYGEHDEYSPEAPFKQPDNPFPDNPIVVETEVEEEEVDTPGKSPMGEFYEDDYNKILKENGDDTSAFASYAGLTYFLIACLCAGILYVGHTNRFMIMRYLGIGGSSYRYRRLGLNQFDGDRGALIGESIA